MVSVDAPAGLDELVATATTSGRVLLTTVFGDALLPRQQAVSVVDLARLVEPLDMNERAVRTSLSRLASEGVVTSERHGRRSLYRVAPSALSTFERADERIYRRARAEWDGQWTVAILDPDTDAANRTRFQGELGWLGMAAVGPGSFASPTVSADDVAEVAERVGVSVAAVVRGRLDAGSLHGDPKLADFADPSGELHLLYERHIRRWESAETAGLDDAGSFALRTLLLDEWRRIALRAVAVPDELLPDDWPGEAARRITIDRYDEVLDRSERFLDSVLGESATSVRSFTDR